MNSMNSIHPFPALRISVLTKVLRFILKVYSYMTVPRLHVYPRLLDEIALPHDIQTHSLRCPRQGREVTPNELSVLVSVSHGRLRKL